MCSKLDSCIIDVVCGLVGTCVLFQEDQTSPLIATGRGNWQAHIIARVTASAFLGLFASRLTEHTSGMAWQTLPTWHIVWRGYTVQSLLWTIQKQLDNESGENTPLNFLLPVVIAQVPVVPCMAKNKRRLKFSEVWSTFRLKNVLSHISQKKTFCSSVLHVCFFYRN